MKIHTFEVSTMLTNEKYYNIQKDFKEKDKSKWKSTKNGMQYWGLADNGILINMFQIKKKDYYAYSVTYRISARRVIENNNFVLWNAYYTKDEINKMFTSVEGELDKIINGG